MKIDTCRVWLYAPVYDLNDATRYYIETLSLALGNVGRRLHHVQTIDAVPKRAEVLVLDCKRGLVVTLCRPRCTFWLWLQGIIPEEAELQLDSKFRKAYWTTFERFVIPRARGVFMVSTAMKKHYGRKYGFSSVPTFVMPCVNQMIDRAAFGTPAKYTRPSFVYAGSLSRWQCFEETLRSFALVQKSLPHATLTVLTCDRDKARDLIGWRNVSNVVIDYVPSDRLQAALAQFKYGFVLRNFHPVNAVATPTKVSSYMAAGVIPILTKAVHDYASRLESVDPVLMLDSTDPDYVSQKILQMEQRSLQADSVYEQYSVVFREYFNREVYLPRLEAFFRSTGLMTLNSNQIRNAPSVLQNFEATASQDHISA